MKRKRIRIGFVADYLNSEYSECLVSGITTCCKEHNIELLIYQIGKIRPDARREGHDYQFLAISSQVNENNVDGIIISSGTQLHGMSKSAFTSYLRSYKPLKIVSLAHELQGIPSIVCDAKNAQRALIQYLIKEQGCRKFGIMSVESDSKEMNSRAEVIREVLKENKIPSSNIVQWKCNFHYASAYGILNDYYTKKKKRFDFDALIAMNDDLAFACMDFCTQRANLRIPEDIVVTGFDDMQRASFCTPTLTTINQQVYYQGYKAALTLINQINCEEVPMLQTIEAKAILRESTAKKKNVKKQFSGEFIELDLAHENSLNDRFSVSEWFNKRQQVFQAAQMDAYIQDELVMEKVGDRVSAQISSFGIQAAAVVLYEQPSEFRKPFEFFNLPEKAKMVACFDYTDNGELTKFKHPIEFNPTEEIIPEGYINFTPEGLITMSLFRNSLQYGYILMRRGNFDTSVYDLIAKAVSIQIDESFEYSIRLKTKVVLTEGYNMINEITHLDYLTGLKNSKGFQELGDTSLKYAQAMGQGGLILSFDIKNINRINDTYGHKAGDQAIKTFAEILRQHFRSNDIIARIDGDKFVAISTGLTVDNYKKICSKISAECAQWKETSGQPFEIAVNSCFVMFPSLKYGYDLYGLMEKVGQAMLKEKQ